MSPAREVLGERLDVGADHGGRERDVGAGQLGEAVGGRPQRQLGLTVLRPPEVGDQHEPGPPVAELLDGGEGGADPRVVGDRPVVEWHVEIDALEHQPAVDLTQVPEGLHRILWTRSTIRFE